MLVRHYVLAAYRWLDPLGWRINVAERRLALGEDLQHYSLAEHWRYRQAARACKSGAMLGPDCTD